MSLNQIYEDQRKPWLNGRFENLTVDGTFTHSGSTGIEVCSINCDETLSIHGATGVRVTTDGTAVDAYRVFALSGGMNFEADKDITIRSQSDNVNVIGDADARLEALSGNMFIQAPSGIIDIDAGVQLDLDSALVDMDGDVVNINANAGALTLHANGGHSFDLQGSASSSVQATAGDLTVTSANVLNLFSVAGDIVASSGNKVNINSNGAGADSVVVEAVVGGIEFKTALAQKMRFYDGPAVHTEMDSVGIETTAIRNFGGQGINCPNGVVIPAPKGIIIASSATSDGVVVANAVSVDGTCGKITDSGIVVPGTRSSITVTNPQVNALSRIFVQAQRGVSSGGVGNSAPLNLDVENVAGGSFTLEVYNNFSSNTDSAPIYQYLIIND